MVHRYRWVDLQSYVAHKGYIFLSLQKRKKNRSYAEVGQVYGIPLGHSWTCVACSKTTPRLKGFYIRVPSEARPRLYTISEDYTVVEGYWHYLEDAKEALELLAMGGAKQGSNP
jgi:hypothetical protein